MTIRQLYTYTNALGARIVTPIETPDAITHGVRLIADEGYLLIKDGITTAVIDTESADGWSEIPEPPEDEDMTEDMTEDDYIAVLQEMGVNLDEKG